jgi:hypothetical protein
MTSMQTKKVMVEKKSSIKKPYHTPAIIYTGHITTRAGSPTSINGSPDGSAVDPTDLFGDN